MSVSKFFHYNVGNIPLIMNSFIRLEHKKVIFIIDRKLEHYFIIRILKPEMQC